MDKAEHEKPESDEAIVAEALKRFERSQSYWSESRDLLIRDMQFSLGDAHNEWQWPDWALGQRKEDKRPVLTINKLPQHLAQVTNEVRQNPPQPKIRPVDAKADTETAEVFTGIVRHIWNNGDAVFALSNAADWQVAGGYGYFRVHTDYVDDGSLEQEIYVRPIIDPGTVYDDPAIQLPTGADRRWCFVVEDMPREDFRAEYPDAQEVDFSGSSGTDGWWQEETVRVAEYWVSKARQRELVMYADGTTGYADEVQSEFAIVKRRIVEVPYVCWYKISGSEILDKRDLPNKCIPIVRVVGVEKIVDGKRIIKGLVRNSKDAQRMYNFWATAYAERVALSPKAPFIGPAGFAEGFEDRWRLANVKNYSYLEYNVVHDDSGNPLPGPQRQLGPDVPSGFVQGMMLASDDIKATTGQYDASLGAQSNETSGRAIMARQREGDVGTYHYIDNLSKAVAFAGQIIVDIAPKVYDTQRVARILGEDGAEDFAQLDPESPEAIRKVRDMDGKIRSIYNIGVGRYDVSVSTGPTYTTKRAESADLMTALAQSDPTLMQRAGDIIVRNFDIAGADELSKRLKLFLPPNVLEAEGDGEGMQMPPQIRAAVQQVEQANQMLDAKAQELQSVQQQIEQEGSAVNAQKAQLRAAAERLRSEQTELELRKQLAIKDIDLALARLESRKAQAREDVEEFVESVTQQAAEEIPTYGT